MSDTMEVTILGRKIGTAYNWDRVDDTSLFFYEFELAEEYGEILACYKGGLSFDYEKGEFSDKNGENVKDVIDTLKD